MSFFKCKQKKWETNKHWTMTEPQYDEVWEYSGLEETESLHGLQFGPFVYPPSHFTIKSYETVYEGKFAELEKHFLLENHFISVGSNWNCEKILFSNIFFWYCHTVYFKMSYLSKKNFWKSTLIYDLGWYFRFVSLFVWNIKL